MWFDGQVDRFDDRAGLEPAAGRKIAQAILDLSRSTGDDVILDVGAGTGTIGVHFATLAGRYFGLDLSPRMLEAFREKLRPWPRHMLLLLADSDHPWPVRDHALAVIFASRVVHHLQMQHFIREVMRTCRPGGCLFLGQVTRDADSLPSRLQQYKRSLLAEHGIHTRAGGQAIQQIVDACCTQGATALEPTAVVQWTRTTTPRQLLAAWEGKPLLNSRVSANALGPDQRTAIVNALTIAAQQEFGDLDRPHEFSEAYTLQGVRLSSTISPR
jgi:ubiquinone/menaquinone biosynthesis C-methylase UbiE